MKQNEFRYSDNPNVGTPIFVFAYRIKELRLKKQVSQREMANKLGFAQTTYSQYELGKRHPDFTTLIKIADFLNVSIDYLLGRTDDPSQQKCNMDKQEKRSTLCDKELRRAFQIGVEDHQSGVPCILKSSIDVKVLLSKFESNGLACALIAEAWVKGWMHDTMQI